MDHRHSILLGLYGNPVEHSLSPLMQNSTIQRLGWPYVYLPFKINKKGLKDAVTAIRALHMGGVNVTIPFKEEIIPYLDDLTPAARACGAVNLVKNDNGHLIGFNTDGEGFIRSLAEEGIIPRGRVLFIGAGGAARALAYAISLLNVEHMDFLDIDATRAKNLAAAVLAGARCSTAGHTMQKHVFEECGAAADLIINCTAVGMFPKVDDCPVTSLDCCKKDTVVYDLVYNPLQTRFLLMAQDKGFKALSGLSMLVHQGALSLEIISGASVPVSYMKEVVFDYYEKQSRLHTG